MSKCVVHMQKAKMSDVGGYQSHNQREHESRKNKEIDKEMTQYNYDTVNDGRLKYGRAVKDRIAELNLKKAPRKDAVVYCSFIISSDREFFFRLGREIHERKQKKERSENFWDSSYSDMSIKMDDYPKAYQVECIKEGAGAFFERATEFFQERYRAENVINGTIHLDELGAPHMHLGVVPVTSDGRLSAKSLFNPTELRNLQTDFAREVGKEFGLERGLEGSEAKHLDEVSYKLKQRTEQLEEVEKKCEQLEQNVKHLEKYSESLSKTISELEGTKDTLEGEISVLEAKKDEIELSDKNLWQQFLDKHPNIRDMFQKFCEELRKKAEQRRTEKGYGMSDWNKSLDRSVGFALQKPFGKQNEICAENENDDVLE